MRIEHRLKSLESVAEPAPSFVVVSDAAEAERYRAEHPAMRLQIIVTGVPRAKPVDV